MADDIVNTFAAISDMTTVHYDCFVNYRSQIRVFKYKPPTELETKLNGTDPECGRRNEDSLRIVSKGLVDIIKSTRWIQDNYGHSLTVEEFSQALNDYI